MTSEVSPLGPGCYHELRIHGVAGSSPESMLGLRAELTDIDVGRPDHHGGVEPAPEDVSVWGPAEVDPRLRAWSWGSLTSGRWYQAFYLLLLPFMIANLAGWMLVAQRRSEPLLRVSTFLVRAVGMLVTVVLVVSVQLVLADLVVWQWLHRTLGWPLWTVGLGPAATAAVFLALVALTRIRLRPEAAEKDPWDDRTDPVGQGFLDDRQDLLWNSPGINVALRRLHLTVGLGTIALLAAWPAGRVDGLWAVVRLLAFGAALVALALVGVLLARISLGAGTGLTRTFAVVRRGTWPVAAAAVALAVAVPFGLRADADLGPVLPALRGAALWVTVAVLVGVLILLVVGLVAAPGRHVGNAPSLLLLAASVGAAFGAGLAAQTTGLVCGPERTCLDAGDHVAWLAIGVTTSLAVLVAVTTVRWAWLRHAHGGWREAFHHLTHRGTWITTVLGGCGTVLSGIGIALALGGPEGMPPVEEFPAVLAAAVVALLLGPLVAVALLVAWTAPVAADRRAGRTPSRRTHTIRFLAATGVVAAVGLVAAAVRNGWTLPVLGRLPGTFAEFALAAAVVLPTAAVLTRVYGGLTSRGVRRGVGVLWDVGTFWPRWFHPLAPPTYSDRAVRRLVAQLDADLDGAGHRMLLAPHSQGAVIAATAVLAGPPRPCLAMLSYGSPWGHLYAEFFPTQVNEDSTASVAARLDDGDGPRWHNLYRSTDPIGGPLPGTAVGARDRQIPDPRRRGHSDYWPEPEYVAAASTLSAALDDRVGA